MLKKYTLIFYLSCLSVFNLFGVQENFAIDEKTRLQLKNSLDEIHDYYLKYKQQSLDELCNYEFEDPFVVKKSVLSISNCFSNSFFKNSFSKNNFIKKYVWLIKNNDPIIKEAAAYYYSVDLPEKNSLTWKLEFINEYFLLLKDRDINVKRAAFYSLSWIILKYDFHPKMEELIYNQINTDTADSFVLGYKILSFAKYKHKVYWNEVKKHYEDAHRFVRLCVLKSFRASINDEIAASWAYDLVYNLQKSLNVENQKDFAALCSTLVSSEKYREPVLILAFNNIYNENKKNKISGFEAMINIFHGNFVKIGNKLYVDTFVSTVSLDLKIKIFYDVINSFHSDDSDIQEMALNLCAEFTKRAENEFDLGVMQLLAIDGFDNFSIKVKVAAVKIFNNLANKNFDLKTAAQIAKQALNNKNTSLKQAGRELFNIINSKK